MINRDPRQIDMYLTKIYKIKPSQERELFYGANNFTHNLVTVQQPHNCLFGLQLLVNEK